MWTTTKSTKEKVMIVSLLMMLLQTTMEHGMMIEPPQRSSMWRFNYTDSPTNYDDNQLFCGGFSIQWDVNGGKCGVCGDDYNATEPRENEAGGKYATGVIVRTYEQGEVINVTVRITANHKGYFIFKLCPNNNVTKTVTHECLNRHVLRAVGPSGEDMGEKYYIDTEANDKNLTLQLPNDVFCSQCVLQWTYNTGNSWRCNNGTEGCCLGCGPQENFVNCADIAITGSGNATVTSPPPSSPPPSSPPPSSPPPSSPPPSSPPPSSPPPSSPPPSSAPPSSPPPSSPPPSSPPPSPLTPVTAPTTTMTTTEKSSSPTSGSQTGSGGCQAAGNYANVSGMKEWCDTNCAAGFCPSTHCSCP